MRKSILVLIFILISSYLIADFYLIPDSNTRKINESELKDKTLNFLIYARNEIFARYGYIFKNPDLNIYFRNMTWYKQKSSDVKLNEFEEYNVNLIKQVEDTRNKNLKIFPENLPYRYFFNGKPLFYFGSIDQAYVAGDRIDYRLGELLLLDETQNWSLSCKTIPYEFIKQNIISEIDNIKSGESAIDSASRIQIYDIDNLNHLIHKQSISEIVIQANKEIHHEEGWVYIFEENSNGELEEIFQANGDLVDLLVVNDNLLELHLSRIKTIDDFPAATGLVQKYLLNRSTNKMSYLPLKDEDLSYQFEYKCISKIPIYADAISACKKNVNAITGYLQNHTRLEIFEFYYSPENYDSENVFRNLKAFRFESIGWNHEGWVSMDDFKDHFKPLYAGG